MCRLVDLTGIFPPLPTSFGIEDDLLTEKMQENILQLNQFELRGYLILGSNGELVNLSEDEKLAVYEATRAVIPKDKLMLAGTGAQSTKETIRLTIGAGRAGADAALVLNPSYYKGLMTKQALVAHYHDVAEESVIPVIIYNMPANSGMDMDAETIREIAAHPNIIGLKDSGGNLTKMGQIIHEAKEGFQVLAGSAGFLLPALSLGAAGGILALANIAPQESLNIIKAFNEGDLKNAAELQRRVIKLNTAITRGWGVPALKTAMDHQGLYGGPCRKPIQPLDNEVIIKLKNLITESLNL